MPSAKRELTRIWIAPLARRRRDNKDFDLGLQARSKPDHSRTSAQEEGSTL